MLSTQLYQLQANISLTDTVTNTCVLFILFCSAVLLSDGQQKRWLRQSPVIDNAPPDTDPWPAPSGVKAGLWLCQLASNKPSMVERSRWHSGVWYIAVCLQQEQRATAEVSRGSYETHKKGQTVRFLLRLTVRKAQRVITFSWLWESVIAKCSLQWPRECQECERHSKCWVVGKFKILTFSLCLTGHQLIY